MMFQRTKRCVMILTAQNVSRGSEGNFQKPQRPMLAVAEVGHRPGCSLLGLSTVSLPRLNLLAPCVISKL